MKPVKLLARLTKHITLIFFPCALLTKAVYAETQVFNNSFRTVKIEGVYTVPVSSEFEKDSHFPVVYTIQLNSFGEPEVIDYDLPGILLPQENRAITLSQPRKEKDGHFSFSQAPSFANCHWKLNTLICSVTYPHISFNFEDHIQSLNQYFPKKIIERYTPIIQSFSNEPEGEVLINMGSILGE